MKKALIPILIFLGVATWGLWPEPVPVGAAQLGLANITDTQLINAIKAAEAKATSYFPIVVTHDSPPSEAVVGDYTKRPQNRRDGITQNMAEALNLKFTNTPLPFSVEVRTCELGIDTGYTIYLERVLGGVRQQRIEGVGVCAEPSMPWTDSPIDFL